MGQEYFLFSFNSRAHTGREVLQTAAYYSIKFQLTRPHGARQR
jgi:hypothetical protein